MIEIAIERRVPLWPYTTLRVGGPAELFARARTVDELAALAVKAHREGIPLTVLGWGSNVLASDHGVRGLVVWNSSRELAVSASGEVIVSTGYGFQELFLRAAQAGLAGLEFAVGIPGSVGGALVSNAGAYRASIGEFVTGVEVVQDGERGWVEPQALQFAYRDSILRRPDPPRLVLLRVRLKLPRGDRRSIYREARDYQRQRIAKQPAPASAGSFFKNVSDPALARELEGLPDRLREAGVVPAGYLIEAVGLKGLRHGGAMISRRHANFLLNVGKATAGELRDLAELARQRVLARFGVALEEEVLYLGDWSAYRPFTRFPEI